MFKSFVCVRCNMKTDYSLAVVIISILIAFIRENFAIIGNNGVSEYLQVPSLTRVPPLITYSREFVLALRDKANTADFNSKPPASHAKGRGKFKKGKKKGSRGGV